jgi:hypothetical protein
LLGLLEDVREEVIHFGLGFPLALNADLSRTIEALPFLVSV